METIRGKAHIEMDAEQLSKRLSGCERVVLDLGTGDGRYVRTLAERKPDWFVVGVDACRENLREHSRASLPNALFVIAAFRAIANPRRGRIFLGSWLLPLPLLFAMLFANRFLFGKTGMKDWVPWS